MKMSKIWQISGAAISYFLFGLGAIIIGVVFCLLSFVPLIKPATKQIWIRWSIHIGCLAFINVMRLFGLIRYSYSVATMLNAKSGHIVIANHPTLIDVVLLFAVNKNLSCLVKSSLWDNVFTGPVVRLAGFIPNNSNKVIPMAVEKLKGGENLLIFPEGTRKENDNGVHFKRGASNVAVAADAAIIPVLIKCYPSALRKEDRWYDIPDGGLSFSLSSGQSLKLSECIDTTKPRTLQYRELTQFLENYYKHWIVTE